MKKAFLLTGSNLGNREENLSRAIRFLSLEAGYIVNFSNIYESTPWGFDAEQKFLNQAIELNTNLLPIELLNKIFKIEHIIGRRRNGNAGYSSREIDIDIIFYNDEIINEELLTIPHPLITQRRFALVPLTEICPFFIHPQLKKTVTQLLSECKDNATIYLYKNST